MPLYANRQELKNRPESESWVDIDDVEFFTLGNADRLAEGEEPPASRWPDPIDDAEASLHTTHDIPVARRIVPTTPKERIIVVSGEAYVETETARATLKKMQWIDVPAGGAIVRNALNPGPEGHRGQVEIARIAGRWGEAVRTAIFTFGPGRPCDYHYHDGDEYWFVFRGHFTLRYRGQDHEVQPGAILAAGMGEEHGVVDPSETFEGIGFATQLEGRKRDGHLWRAVHGEPVETR
ncbi:cupin domain-containing protein [Luethyella okanaganae]|uniref:Cupin domain-containing protein n=1 Tax=Luethyella okanaganae TaxID=69372 RepID=A0ABW1VHV8_9MICO